MSNLVKENQYARFYDDGSIDVMTTPTGHPSFDYRFSLHGKEGEERQKELDLIRGGFALDGLLITREQMVRNKILDKRGEQSTCLITARVCKNESEVKQVCAVIRRIHGESPDVSSH